MSEKGVSASILLVGQDEAGLQQLLSKLQSASFRVAVALGGRLGYERAQASPPDVIFAEQEMTGMDGISLLRLLKSNPLTRDIPVLLTSVEPSPVLRLHGFREGAVDVIVKPFHPDEVQLRLQVQLDWLHKLREASAADTNRSSDASPHGLTDQDILVQAVQKHILDNLGESTSVADLAQKFNVSERRLVTAFKNCLDMSVFAYAREQRMLKAQYLLANTVLSMDVIAAEVGFSSAANFSTAFHGYCRTTPTGYRTAAHEKAWQERESALAAGGDGT